MTHLRAQAVALDRYNPVQTRKMTSHVGNPKQMNKVVLALGVSLGALSLAACDAQDAPMLEQAEAAAPAPVDTVAPQSPDATVVEDVEAPAE